MDPSAITFNWRRCKDIPRGFDVHEQPVSCKGKLYLRSGTDTVLEYTPNSDRWAKLPPPSDSNSFFSLASARDRLFAVGGEYSFYHTERSTDSILTFEESSQRWRHRHSMPKALTSPVVFTYQEHLIVTGGHNESEDSITDVNILNINSSRWLSAQPLPSGGAYRTVVIGDTVYFIGRYHKTVLSANIPTLISGAKSGVWKSLPDVPYYRSSPIIIGNSLLVAGGSDQSLYGHPTTSIYIYDPTTNQWVKVGDLPEPMSEYSCINFHSQLFVFSSHQLPTSVVERHGTVWVDAGKLCPQPEVEGSSAEVW